MTGQTWGKEVEMEMTNIVRCAVASAGSVRELSRRLRLDEDIIEDIRTGKAYQMTPATFEDRFKQPLKSLRKVVSTDAVEKKPSTVTKKEDRIVPVEIRCPGYDDMVKLIERTGRKVKIVYA